jgi:hypothetical protein
MKNKIPTVAEHKKGEVGRNFVYITIAVSDCGNAEMIEATLSSCFYHVSRSNILYETVIVL